MPTIHVKDIRKLVLALEKAVVFDLHLVNDLDLHSVENITMTERHIQRIQLCSLHQLFDYLITFYCFRNIKT